LQVDIESRVSAVVTLQSNACTPHFGHLLHPGCVFF
jgi:hypothetical protein